MLTKQIRAETFLNERTCESNRTWKKSRVEQVEEKPVLPWQCILSCKNSYYFSNNCSTRQMYTERFSLFLSISLSFSPLHFRFDEICIRGNESQDPEGRQVAMPSQLRVSFVCVHTVKMKWPRALITVQKGLKTGVGNVGPRCIN